LAIIAIAGFRAAARRAMATPAARVGAMIRRMSQIGGPDRAVRTGGNLIPHPTHANQATWIEMSFFKKQPEYLDRQANASKARGALLEKFRSKTESDEDFAKRQATLMEIRVAREAREAERKAAAEAARAAEAERQAALKAEEEERARALEAEQKAARDARYASRKKRKKGLRYARPTG
jgi:hypothetical protein